MELDFKFFHGIEPYSMHCTYCGHLVEGSSDLLLEIFQETQEAWERAWTKMGMGSSEL